MVQKKEQKIADNIEKKTGIWGDTPGIFTLFAADDEPLVGGPQIEPVIG